MVWFWGPPWDHTVSYDRGPGKAVRWRPAGKEASKHWQQQVEPEVKLDRPETACTWESPVGHGQHITVQKIRAGRQHSRARKPSSSHLPSSLIQHRPRKRPTSFLTSALCSPHSCPVNQTWDLQVLGHLPEPRHPDTYLPGQHISPALISAFAP